MLKVIEPTNVLPLSEIPESGFGKDLLTEVLRKGARELLAQAVEQEAQEWLHGRWELRDERGSGVGRSQRTSAGTDDSHRHRSRRSATAECEGSAADRRTRTLLVEDSAAVFAEDQFVGGIDSVAVPQGNPPEHAAARSICNNVARKR